MTAVTVDAQASLLPRTERMFPTLTPEQIARVAAQGHKRAVKRGEVLVDSGQEQLPFFVVLSGELEVVRSSATGEELITTHRRGQFTGEINLLSGRRGLASIRVSQDGEVIELARDALLTLVQTDAELGE